MSLLDIHTHRVPADPFQAIQSCSPIEFSQKAKGYFSIGLHPWYLAEYTIQEIDRWKELFSLPQVLAVGEAGLDKSVPVPMDLQQQFFVRQIKWAEECGKPLVIHAVRANSELISLKKTYKPAVPWVIHGFRGRPQLAEEYLRHDFYLSFGEKYNEEALRITPMERLFLETDESLIAIQELYDRAANIKGLMPEEFQKRMEENVSLAFFRNS